METGYDAVDDFRARLWLRRGKPSNYAWDDPSAPSHRAGPRFRLCTYADVSRSASSHISTNAHPAES